MAVNSDGSPKPMKGRTKYGATSRKRRSSKARSSISGGSWDQISLPLSLRQASYSNGVRTTPATESRHPQSRRLTRPFIRGGDPRVLLSFNQSSEQGRPFDAFVDVPSPFAKQKVNPIAKRHKYRDIDHHSLDRNFTSNPNSKTQPFHISPPPSSPDYFDNEIHFIPDTNMKFDHVSQKAPGYIDSRTRAMNLQHTRPEWTTWDFVDLFLNNLPPGIKTVDLWNNFKVEGQVDLIDIFVTRSGQKDSKARLRFRQAISNGNITRLTTVQTTTKKRLLHNSEPIHTYLEGWSNMANSGSV